MMDEQTKLILALYQVDNLTQLTKDNEYKHYLYCKLSSIKCELERQLTNLTNQSKIKEQTDGDND
jgi:hypothetical protein|tara:strand:+ start:538 stop:732 length:195 start_codon:yes stop_codon:yes gene_type:complete